MPTPQQQLAAFFKKYDPKIARQAQEAIRYLRRRLPGAMEMVYDNYNALVVGFGPTDKASQAILSIAVYPSWVTLFFLKGARLMDPGKVLLGNGKIVRYIRLASLADLREPAVDALIEQSVEDADPPFEPQLKHRLIIKSISARQRPRKPSKKK